MHEFGTTFPLAFVKNASVTKQEYNSNEEGETRMLARIIEWYDNVYGLTAWYACRASPQHKYSEFH